MPEYFFKYQGPMPWMDFYNEDTNLGIYISCHDTVPRLKALRLEMQPGIAHARKDPWPLPSEIPNAIPAGITINWACFSYLKQHEIFNAPPVVLKFHEGDWHNAALFYREWFTSKFALIGPKIHWMEQQFAFQDTMFLFPEGNTLWKFNDIPR